MKNRDKDANLNWIIKAFRKIFFRLTIENEKVVSARHNFYLVYPLLGRD